MEPAPDPGLGDSSLHRYLDGEFWSLKNKPRRLLGGSPLFRHRYCAAAGRLAVCPRSPRVPGGSVRGAPGQDEASPSYSVQMVGSPPQRCGHRRRPPTSQARREGGLRLPAPSYVESEGWARRRRRGDFLRVAAGRFGAASRPQLFECSPFVSHSGWWEKRQKIRDGVGVDGAQGHRATGYATGAPDQVRRKRARQLRLWVVSAWKRGTFIGTGMDWPCAGHIWASGVGRTPRGPVLGSKGCSSPQGHLMPGQV